MKVLLLLIINDAPYGSERAYNALRLAGSLAKEEGAPREIRGPSNPIRR
jgi:sulfur relay (sulfurtransferase) complex TusBCD TusD component (DsrE family)